MNNMVPFIFLLAVISHLNAVHGISMIQKSSAPTLTVTPSSNSILISWEKLSSWSYSSIFMVRISIPDSVITKKIICEGGHGTMCVFDTEDFMDSLPACTPVTVTIEASGVVVGPQITNTLSPDPVQVNVSVKGRKLYINWELPTSCEKSSKLLIKARDIIVHEKVFSVPENSYIYELSDDISTCDALQVLVKTVNADGESRGLGNTFLYAELKELSVKRIDSSTLKVTWEQPICVSKTEVSWYDATYSSAHLIGRDEVVASSYLVTDAHEQNLTLCIKPKGRTGTQWLEGGETCVAVTELLEPRSIKVAAPGLNLVPHTDSVDIAFLRLFPWNAVKYFTLTIHEGTANTGDKLCNSTFTCNADFPDVCNINSKTYCDPLPADTYVFVEVDGNGQVSSNKIKTLPADPTTTITPEPTDSTTTTTPVPTDPTTTTTPEPTEPTTTTTPVPTDPTTTTTPVPTDPTTTITPVPTDPTTTITPESTDPNTTTTPVPTDPTTTITPVPTDPTTTITPEPTDPNTTITPEPTDPTTPTTSEPTDPNVEVSTSSDSVTVTWNRKGPFSNVDNFHISISDVKILDLNDNIGIRSDLCSANVSCSDPQCSFDSKTGCPEAVFTPCSDISVIVEDGVDSLPPVTAQIAPKRPSEVSVELNGTVVDISWPLPSTCETASRLTVTLEEEEVVNEVLDVPINTYSYASNSDLGCDMGQAIVNVIGKDGESQETSVEFLLTEYKTLWAVRDSDSIILVHWVNPSCVKKTKISWYNETEDNLIGSEEVNGQRPYEISDIGIYHAVLICVIPKAHGISRSWVEGEKQCIIASDPTIPPSTTTSTTLEITTSVAVTTTTAVPTVTSNTEPSDVTDETGTGNTEPNVTDPPDNTALYIGLGVGIPLALIAIAGIAYILKVKVFGKTTTLEMATPNL